MGAAILVCPLQRLVFLSNLIHVPVFVFTFLCFLLNYRFCFIIFQLLSSHSLIMTCLSHLRLVFLSFLPVFMFIFLCFLFYVFRFLCLLFSHFYLFIFFPVFFFSIRIRIPVPVPVLFSVFSIFLITFHGFRFLCFLYYIFIIFGFSSYVVTRFPSFLFF